MRRDLRDPRLLGEAYLKLRSIGHTPDRATDVYVPSVRGDESPLDRYGDPRLYDVKVTTTIERVRLPIARREPIDRLAVIHDGEIVDWIDPGDYE